MMSRQVIFERGPMDGRSATIFRRSEKAWPVDHVATYRDRNGSVKAARYVRKSNRRFVYEGPCPLPGDAYMDVIKARDGTFRLSDPTGANGSYDGLPVPPKGCADPLGFMAPHIDGGTTRLLLKEE